MCYTDSCCVLSFLTPVQMDVVKMMAEGQTLAEIATATNKTEQTVDSMVKAIAMKVRRMGMR